AQEEGVFAEGLPLLAGDAGCLSRSILPYLQRKSNARCCANRGALDLEPLCYICRAGEDRGGQQPRAVEPLPARDSFPLSLKLSTAGRGVRGEGEALHPRVALL
ncbi:MAG TPA: hypothetical protein VM537_28925, partial [Anaerolineae bacterium]|nr:hypothetical protein [Anaerolineae bacterium]